MLWKPCDAMSLFISKNARCFWPSGLIGVLCDQWLAWKVFPIKSSVSTTASKSRRTVERSEPPKRGAYAPKKRQGMKVYKSRVRLQHVHEDGSHLQRSYHDVSHPGYPERWL